MDLHPMADFVYPADGTKEEISIRQASGKDLFNLYQEDGIPFDLSIEELKKGAIEMNISDVVIDEEVEKIKKQFEEELKKHQELSRTAIKGKFKGGLADNSEQAKKYHTTAHLLLAALKNILGDDVEQRGSNINSERLRFDFSYPQKLTDEQKKEIEDWINDKISKKLEVEKEEMSLEEARNSGATGIFDEKYGDPVSVYSILEKETGETFSREICGGPHIENTSELGRFKIIKEESASSGIRRIKAVLE